MKRYPLFETFPKLHTLRPLDICEFPTPIIKLSHTSDTLGAPVWIKNDGALATPYGGNKPRKLEFLLRDALNQAKTTILTRGGLGSNHCLATICSAKHTGFDPVVYLDWQRLNDHVQHNILCDYYFGAEMIYSQDRNHGLKKIQARLDSDSKAYYIPTGGSTPLGTVGFINALFELKEQINSNQLPLPDKIFVPLGSGSTCAGLLAGVMLADLDIEVNGIQVYIENDQTVLTLAKQSLELLQNLDPDIPVFSENEMKGHLVTSDQFYGGDYGIVTHEGIKALQMVFKDGIQLETTYTAKTFSGLIDHCRKFPLDSDQNILYWHTFNSHDLAPIYSSVDYHALPAVFHQFFDGTIPIDREIVQCIPNDK